MSGGHFFAVTKSKNGPFCRVYHFKVQFTFNDFFSLPGLNWPLKDVKHLILVPQDSRRFIIIFSYEHLFDM